MLKARLQKRGSDAWGSGEFGASRGNRIHKGIDYTCDPGIEICAMTPGKVTKLGYPYANALQYRYVEVTFHNRRHRYFYVTPLVKEGNLVQVGDVLGVAQDIASKYSTPDKEMKNHVHYEILDIDGEPIDPEKFHNFL